MKRWTTIVGGALLGVVLLGLALLIGAIVAAGTLHPSVIEINGEPLQWAQLGAGHWLLGVAGVVVAALVVMLVVPVAVVLPLLVVGLVLVGVVLALAGVAALVCSPLLLLGGFGWLIWKLASRPNPGVPAKSDASIAP
jgi:hypothetical protein